jgi:hypothetical protein
MGGQWGGQDSQNGRIREIFAAFGVKVDIMKFTLMASLALLLGVAATQTADASSVRFGAVAGIVTTADGHPVADAVVVIAFRGTNRVLETTTNARGRFVFRRVPQSHCLISATMRNHTTHKRIGVRAGHVTRVHLHF